MSSDQQAVRRLARDLVGLERRIRSVEVQPQLGYSSISDGAINVYQPMPGAPVLLPDGVGTTAGASEFEDVLREIIGRMPDGTFGNLPVNAPPPPTPSIPLLEPAPRGAIVRWDGHNDDGTDVQPLDWSRLEIHSRPVPNLGATFVPSPGSLRGTIETPQGGTLTVSPGLDWNHQLDAHLCVIFVARNTSGVASAPSAPATITMGKVENFDLADMSVTVKKFVSLRHFLY